MTSISALYILPQKAEQAVKCDKEALAEWRAIGDRAGEAAQLSQLGDALTAQGLKDDAAETLNKARTLMHQVGDRHGEATVLGLLAALELAGGNLTQARSDNESALAIVESLRREVPSLDLRATFSSAVHSLYERQVRILMRLYAAEPSKGYDRLALAASERGRAQALVELLNESGADIRRSIEPTLLRQQRVLQKALIQVTSQLSHDPTPPEAPGKLRELLDQYDNLQSKIRTTNPRYAALLQPEPPDIDAIQSRLLDKDTLLLEYSLGETESYLWAVEPGAVSAFILPGRFELEVATESFVAQVQKKRPRLDPHQVDEAGAGLSKILLGPVAEKLGRKQLVIVADGVLSHIPFGLLTVRSAGAQGPLRELLMEHEIVYSPSVSTLFGLRRESAGRTPPRKLLAVLADPVYSSEDERLHGGGAVSQSGRNDDECSSDPREAPVRGDESRRAAPTTRPSREDPWTAFLDALSNSTGVSSNTSLPRLRYTRREADDIVALVADDSLRAELTGFAASKAAVNRGFRAPGVAAA